MWLMALLVASGQDQVAITKEMKRAQAPLRACYERELQRSPSLAGRVVLAFTVKDEAATAIVVESSTLQHAGVERCMIEVLKQRRFEGQREPIDVRYPIVLQRKAVSPR